MHLCAYEDMFIGYEDMFTVGVGYVYHSYIIFKTECSALELLGIIV